MSTAKLVQELVRSDLLELAAGPMYCGKSLRLTEALLSYSKENRYAMRPRAVAESENGGFVTRDTTLANLAEEFRSFDADASKGRNSAGLDDFEAWAKAARGRVGERFRYARSPGGSTTT